MLNSRCTDITLARSASRVNETSTCAHAEISDYYIQPPSAVPAFLPRRPIFLRRRKDKYNEHFQKTSIKDFQRSQKDSIKDFHRSQKIGIEGFRDDQKIKGYRCGVLQWEKKCVVFNYTGGKIAVVAQHVWNNYKDPLQFIVLDINQSASFTINVGSGGSDYWSVWLMATSGRYLYRDNKQCDVYESDLNSGNPINLNLQNQSTGFSIQMPKSSSCVNNYYNTSY